MQTNLHSYLFYWTVDSCYSWKLRRPISIQESVLWSAACYVLKPCHAICSPLVSSKYPSISWVLRTVSVKRLIYYNDLEKIYDTHTWTQKWALHMNIMTSLNRLRKLKRASKANFAQKWTSAQKFLEVRES